jgi:hypothetical protein
LKRYTSVNLIVIPDRDEDGEMGAQKTASRLRGGAASVRVATLPAEFTASNGADVRDVLNGRDGEKSLRQAIEDAVEWQPKDRPHGPDQRPLRNFAEISKGDADGTIVVPLSMAEVIEQVKLVTDSGIRRVGGALFVHDTIAKPNEREVDWLPTAASLFGYLRSRATVSWKGGDAFAGREEFHAELARTAPSHIGVEVLPHEPKLPGHYYACGEVTPGAGSTLAKLLDRFSPELPIDRDLMQAALMTLFWGGLGGTRPVFVITSGDGRGAGKSKTATMMVLVAGGAMDFGAKDEFREIKTRLLSDDGLTKRAAMLDACPDHEWRLIFALARRTPSETLALKWGTSIGRAGASQSPAPRRNTARAGSRGSSPYSQSCDRTWRPPGTWRRRGPSSSSPAIGMPK